jgi:micrococcal nuclease
MTSGCAAIASVVRIQNENKPLCLVCLLAMLFPLISFRSLAFAGLTPLLITAHTTKTVAECRGEDGGSSLVAEIRGGDTLILQDGRAARLAGVLIPKRGRDAHTSSQPREAAEKQITELLVGQAAELHLDARQRDRYGRILAQVFVMKDGERIWVQEKLITSGLARVISFKENRHCITELLALEKTARETKAGLWGSQHFAIMPAASEDVLAGLTQSYEIVEGQVENVAEVRGRIYLNFGKNWRRDFTATISGDALNLFPDGSQSITALRGRPVRVRGWIENINGPSINITHPEQLEIIISGAISQR